MNTDETPLPAVSHPGFMLKEGLDDLGISQYRLGKDLGIPHSTVTGIVQGKLSITVPIALKLGRYFQTSADYWLGLQQLHDRETAEDRMREELAAIQPAPEVALSA